MFIFGKISTLLSVILMVLICRDIDSTVQDMSLSDSDSINFGNKMSELKTVYEYFVGEKNDSECRRSKIEGLTDKEGGVFRLNGKPIRLISGAIHYFRIHPDLWRDRLRKLRACGANTVETYVPWNLHEIRPGEFDFGETNPFLNVRKFLKMAQEEDLLVLFRPGPYICSEWDLGGFPSWLLKDPEMKLRTSYKPYLDRVNLYLSNLIPRILDLEFSRGGPIIGIQIENEYGSFDTIDKEYMQFLKNLLKAYDISSLLFTSDGIGANGKAGALEDVLMTANFQSNAKSELRALLSLQPQKPLMVMEFWTGWFDHWFEDHHTWSPEEFGEVLEEILQLNSSVNFYMFHGGTNFGFMAGANTSPNPPYYAPDITSYDYDALLSEAGDYTPKYLLAKEMIKRYELPSLKHPSMPPLSSKRAYAPLKVLGQMSYNTILSKIPNCNKFKLSSVGAMEDLPLYPLSGQNFGYIVYSKKFYTTEDNFDVRLETGPMRDFGIVLLDNKLVEKEVQKPFSRLDLHKRLNLTLRIEEKGIHSVDIMVENMGRINFGRAIDFIQKKGILPSERPEDSFALHDVLQYMEFDVYSLDFEEKWVEGLTDWNPAHVEKNTNKGPHLLYFELSISEEPLDTFLDMTGWRKGIVFVNGFNLGRYFEAGPTRTLYIPAPLLKKGVNKIIIFEQFEYRHEIVFREEPKLGDNNINELH